MGDMIDLYRDMDNFRRAERERFGVKCPVCIERLPKAQPKILLPGQTCRAHRPHFRDDRPQPTAAEFNAAMAGTGWTQEAAS